MLKNFLAEIIDAPLGGVVRSYIPEKHFIGKKMLVSYSCDSRLCYISMLGNIMVDILTEDL